jgi:hypothetical protein
MTTSSSTSAQPTAAPIFQSGLPTTSTSTSRYTGTGRPTYSLFVTSDGRVRRSKQGASLPTQRSMRFMASRMCRPGDENIVQISQEEFKDDAGYDSPTAPSIAVTNLHADSVRQPYHPQAYPILEQFHLIQQVP